MKKTAVIGASPNPERYSNIAVRMLREYGHEVVALGLRADNIDDVLIRSTWPDHLESLDTITLYLGPKNQPQYYNYILGLKPKRIIFNPGTENSELSALAKIQGIDVVEACTLVMLRTNQF